MGSAVMVSSWLIFLVLAATYHSHGEFQHLGGDEKPHVKFDGSPVAPELDDSSSKISNATSLASRGSGGVNVLAAMLVTASSVMVFMAFRLSVCRHCTGSSPNSNDQLDNAFETSVEDGQEAVETMTTDLREGSERRLKKEDLGLGLDSIEKFTVLMDYQKLMAERKMGNADKCSVCLCEFKAITGEEVRLLPWCNHFFHPDCIDLWLVSHKSCPVCRGSVIPPGSSSTGTIPSRNFGVEPESPTLENGGGQHLVLQIDRNVA